VCWRAGATDHVGAAVHCSRFSDFICVAAAMSDMREWAKRRGDHASAMPSVMRCGSPAANVQLHASTP
jgi:hypothetical protein